MERVFDFEALERAGFEKTLTSEEWEEMQNDISLQAHSDLRVDYILRRGDVTLHVEQNNKSGVPVGGATVTANYPQIVVLSGPAGKVAVAAGDTDLILAMAAQVAGVPG